MRIPERLLIGGRCCAEWRIYIARYVGIRPSPIGGNMSVCGKPSWFRRVAFAAAVLATASLTLGAMPRPAAAQYYGGYGYPGYAYPYPYYPYYPYYYPYYAYGYPYWGWGYPYFGVGFGFGFGRGFYGRGFYGRGFYGRGFGGAGFRGGGFGGGGFHGGGGGGHR
jgi:hypothetical protein